MAEKKYVSISALGHFLTKLKSLFALKEELPNPPGGENVYYNGEGEWVEVPQGPVGPAGPAGPTGSQGPAGTNAKITSVNITVDDSHLDQPTATATITGAAGDQTLGIDFKGLLGATGPQGSPGAAGKDGAAGAKGDPGGYYQIAISEGKISLVAKNGAPAVATTWDYSDLGVDPSGKVGSTTVGSATQAIYLENGVPKVVTKVASASVADTLGTVDVGSATSPIYLAKGKPAAITKVAAATKADSADTATSAGSATTATKLAEAVQINGVDFDGSESITIADSTKLPLTGGDITGAITATGNITGAYLVGTWLQTKSTNDLGKAPDRYPVLDASGWLYYRTTAEMKSDLGISSVDTSSFVTKTEFASLLQSNIETIRTALGLVTTARNGLVPALPSNPNA